MRREWFDVPARASAVGRARDRAGGWMRERGLPEDLGFTAQLVVSEFITNAIVHTRSDRISCRLQVCDKRLRIEVVDEGGCASEVRPRDAAAGDVNGRGLQLVGAVADQWGVQSGGVWAGRTVWAELPLAAS